MNVSQQGKLILKECCTCMDSKWWISKAIQNPNQNKLVNSLKVLFGHFGIYWYKSLTSKINIKEWRLWECGAL